MAPPLDCEHSESPPGAPPGNKLRKFCCVLVAGNKIKPDFYKLVSKPQTQKAPTKHKCFIGAFWFIRQRPTLPHSCPCSTIGAIQLNFRVRDGNGCDLNAIVTE